MKKEIPEIIFPIGIFILAILVFAMVVSTLLNSIVSKASVDGIIDFRSPWFIIFLTCLIIGTPLARYGITCLKAYFNFKKPLT